MDQARIDVEPNCGPMIVLNFDSLIVLQNVNGSCAALDINPFGNPNIGRHWVVLSETNKVKNAIVVSETGFMVYFSDIPFLKNQVLQMKPDDFWNCDFMSDERITAVFQEFPVCFGTSHGRVGKIVIDNGQIDCLFTFT